LDIGRRVVEGLKPGFAQLGSVWLPLPHLLMVLTIWNDFMWHSGLAGALESMISFVFTGVIIYKFLKHLNVGMLGRLVGVGVFIANVNILYMQSTAMTELLLLATMTAGVYELFLWQKENKLLHLIYSAFWIMLATLNRYDGWFLFL
jgi:ABC-type polysaccharide/polyol phosphate export permease